MTKIDIIRAWKDESYFASLTDAEKNLIPHNPAGLIELHDDVLQVVGGQSVIRFTGLSACCYLHTFGCGGAGSTSGYCPTP